MVPETSFRVIIVGAGVAGITLAHCLAKANIDYVLLEKGVVGPAFGTTITLQPHGCRVLHQLGCLEAIISTCSHMAGASCRDSSGKTFAYNKFFEVVKEHAGYDTRTLDRQLFLKTMYQLLPDTSKVHEGTRVQEVIESDSGVRVVIADGREFTGDLVVGTDGVHSKMRELMWSAANAKVPGYITSDEKRSLSTTYCAIVALAKRMPGLSMHDMEVTSHDKLSFLLLCQPEWISYIVHYKLPKDEQCHWPARKEFSDDDMNALAAKLASYPVTDTVLFGELWKNTTKAQMISLEEGVLDHWYFGRTVLAGDAIHKVTPNSALGGNTGIEDVVVITNGLHKALAKHPNKKPTDMEIRDVFQEYQDSRKARVQAIVAVGGDLTRGQAYDGWKHYATQRWLTPVVGLDQLAKNIAGLCITAPKLSFVDFPERQGIFPWQDTLAANTTTTVGKSGKGGALARAWESWDGTIEAMFPHILAVLTLLSVVMGLVLNVQQGHVIPGFATVI